MRGVRERGPSPQLRPTSDFQDSFLRMVVFCE